MDAIFGTMNNDIQTGCQLKKKLLKKILEKGSTIICKTKKLLCESHIIFFFFDIDKAKKLTLRLGVHAQKIRVGR